MEKNLTGYVNLENTSDYQFIYASQSFGTFYCFYAKFAFTTINGKEMLSSIDFYVKNYKGQFKIYFKKDIVNRVLLDKNGMLRIGIPVVPIIGKKENARTENLLDKEIEKKQIDSIYLRRYALKLRNDPKEGIEDGFYKGMDIEDLVCKKEDNEAISFTDFMESEIDLQAIGMNCRESLVKVDKSEKLVGQI
ncbi:hypothetical protein [Tenacibaculum sp. SG-28]|uniref:hypothetical protein n=1 Tax=Tenacibaculum sp. SG-28 TaxID=754426 RepID=UPI000CF38575|nr:hypothetical protein [Tenacibaculum sp. SG-28]PQJ19920.1 hypothetical protein BSU00_11415 [Tenacibaculum sp. SG-28]